MFTRICIAVLCLSATALAEGPSLTLYNQSFAVVRESVPLELKQGINEVRYSEMSAHLEADSVILRDPTGKITLRILEQNYWNDPISQGLLLQHYEGKDLQFEVFKADGSKEIVTGKLIRSGYIPHAQGLRQYGQQYYQVQSMMYDPSGGSGQPIVEVNGKIQFNLPGTPIFDMLAEDYILKPTANWKIDASEAGNINAELSYVTGGMGWEATYNLVAPTAGNLLEVTGWVTMDNQSGKEYLDAAIQLMAGDVQKIQPGAMGGSMRANLGYAADAMQQSGGQVSERSFDEFHLYTLPNRTTLKDRETKQVEFVRAEDITSSQFYVYKGVSLGDTFRPYYGSGIDDPTYGAQSTKKIWIMREFKNSEENHLGIALPKGLMRFYRRDGEALQFIGESTIDHTPKDEMVRAYLGNAFDLVGERRQTDFRRDYPENLGQYKNRITEKFEIKLRNHKTEAVQIRVEEDLYRWTNWRIAESSIPHTKTDHDTIEFRQEIPIDGETTLTYTVEYLW